MAFNVLILDDQPLVVEALQRVLRMLDDTAGIEPIADLGALLERLHQRPDALVFLSHAESIHDPSAAVTAIREVAPNAKVVIYGDCSDRAKVRELFLNGADAVIPSQSSIDIVAAATRLVAAGGKYLPPEVFGPALSAAEASITAIKASDYRLTPQQRKVLGLLALGLSNRRIAERLGIAEGTVKLHVNAILKSLDVPNRTAAALLARDLLEAPRSDLRKAG